MQFENKKPVFRNIKKTETTTRRRLSHVLFCYRPVCYVFVNVSDILDDDVIRL